MAFRRVECAFLEIGSSGNIADQLESVPDVLRQPNIVPLPAVGSTLQPSGATTETGTFSCMLRAGVSDGSNTDIDSLIPPLRGTIATVKIQEKTPPTPKVPGNPDTAAPVTTMTVLFGAIPDFPGGAVGSKAIYVASGVINTHDGGKTT